MRFFFCFNLNKLQVEFLECKMYVIKNMECFFSLFYRVDRVFSSLHIFCVFQQAAAHYSRSLSQFLSSWALFCPDEPLKRVRNAMFQCKRVSEKRTQVRTFHKILIIAMSSKFDLLLIASHEFCYDVCLKRPGNNSGSTDSSCLLLTPKTNSFV